MPHFNVKDMRRTRVMKNLTQSELAERVGMSTATLCRIERGERMPTGSEIDALNKGLQMPASWPSTFARPGRMLDQPDIVHAPGTHQKLRVQISLETFFDKNAELRLNARKAGAPDPARTVTFYVPLEGLGLESQSVDEEPEIPIQRERAR